MMIDNGLFFLILSFMVTMCGIYIVYQFEVNNVTRFSLLVSYLGGISVLLVIYNVYINFKSNDRIEKNRIAYNTIENIRNNYLGPQKELLKYYPEGYFLYASMNQDTQLGEQLPTNFDPIKRQQVELYFSIRVFQSFEDFLSTASYDITGVYVWINNFVMWMQSPILQHYWSILSFNYSIDTREFVAEIIQKANELVELRKQKGRLVDDLPGTGRHD